MNKFNKLASKGRGFTLLEMIIVLSVVAILLSWGMPSITQSLQNNQVAAQSNELVSMMHFAKSESLRRNADVPILLGSSADGWSAIVEDPAELADVVGCVPGQLRCVSNTGVVLTAAVTQVVFNNRGYIRKAADPWTPETMYVQHSRCAGNNQRRRIDITPTGQISACSLPCDSTAACP
jgi:type IV fimbrial biogenesis protein FimT